MGNQQSTSVTRTDILNEIVTDIVVSARQACDSGSVNIQDINISGISADGCDLMVSDINQNSVAQSTLDCTSKQDLMGDLSSKLTEKLDQEVKSETSGLSGALNSKATSVALARLVASVKKSIDIDVLSSCLLENLNSQKISVSDLKCKDGGKITIKNLNQAIVGGAVQNCFSEQSSVLKVSDEVDRVFSQSAEAKNNGIKLVSGSGMSLSVLLIVFIIISVGYVLYGMEE